MPQKCLRLHREERQPVRIYESGVKSLSKGLQPIPQVAEQTGAAS
jgi:hypothetical protein